MRTFSLIAIGLAAASATFASPAPESNTHDKGTPLHSLSITKVHGKTKPHSYFVKLKQHVDKSHHLQWLRNHTDSDPESDINHDFDSTHFNAFAGKFKGSVLEALRQNPDVEEIVPDSLLKHTATRTQHDATWNLQRINQKSHLAGASQPGKLNFMYSYDDSYAGKNVDIYILDSGVKTNHKDFGTRASWGKIFGGYSKKDVYGHGTHVAGIAAGWRFGVAKKANIISVKTMGDDGSGWSTDMCAGIDWVVQTAKTKPTRHAVINMSIGGVGNPALDQCATNAVKAGVHVVVSAGNDGVDVKDTSPARAPNVITVGASDITDEFAYFSNFGSAVDIIAPGADITSDWPGDSGVETNEMSGTSMAAPHVAGIVALYLSQPTYSKYTPAKISDLIKSLGKDNVISRVPKGTRNDFLQTKAFK